MSNNKNSVRLHQQQAYKNKKKSFPIIKKKLKSVFIKSKVLV